MTEDIKEIKISVRNLVEFILRSGDLDNSHGSRNEVEAMQAGSRIHRKLQKQMGANYIAEVPLSITFPVTHGDVTFELTIEGRADGIIENDISDDFSMLIFEEADKDNPEITIDEIKGVYMDLAYLKEPIGVHMAQAMCYGYIYGTKYQHKQIGIQVTYCNLETENLKYFKEVFTLEELTHWFDQLIREYAKWAVWQMKWNVIRDVEIMKLDFPFPYRPGQKELVEGVYKTILRKKKLFIEAPTGASVIIVTGCINVFKSRVSGTFIKNDKLIYAK